MEKLNNITFYSIDNDHVCISQFDNNDIILTIEEFNQIKTKIENGK